MSLSCDCGFGAFEWYYDVPDDFTVLDTSKRKRCISCGVLVDLGSDCLAFNCYRDPSSDIEEDIHGDEVPLANKHMCFECGSIFLNLTAAGYCISLGGHMKEELEEYWDITGFNPI